MSASEVPHPDSVVHLLVDEMLSTPATSEHELAEALACRDDRRGMPLLQLLGPDAHVGIYSPMTSFDSVIAHRNTPLVIVAVSFSRRRS
jgi:hypothetical protein